MKTLEKMEMEARIDRDHPSVQRVYNTVKRTWYLEVFYVASENKFIYSYCGDNILRIEAQNILDRHSRTY